MNRRVWIFLALAAALLAAAAVLFSRGGGDLSREGKLYPHDPRRVRMLDFVYPDRRLRVEIDDGFWMLSAPLRDLTDRETMLRLFGVLNSASRPETRPWPAARAPLGLDEPSFQLLLHRDGAVDTLRFGTLDPETNKLFAAASWSDSLLLLPVLLRTHFMRNRYHLSDKRPLALDPAREIRAIELDNPAGEMAFRPAADGWEMIALDRYPADARKVRELLRHATGPAILDFLDEDGPRPADLESPRARLRIHLEGEAAPHVLELGGSFAELHLARNPERPRPFLLDSLSAAPLLRAPRDWLPETLFSILPGRVEWIEGPGWRLEQAAGSRAWMDGDGEPVEPRRVSRILARLVEIPAGRLEAMLPRRDQLRDWGLDPPRSAVRFRERGRELRLELGASRDGRRYFRRGDAPAVYSLPAGELGPFDPPDAPAGD